MIPVSVGVFNVVLEVPVRPELPEQRRGVALADGAPQVRESMDIAYQPAGDGGRAGVAQRPREDNAQPSVTMTPTAVPTMTPPMSTQLRHSRRTASVRSARYLARDDVPAFRPIFSSFWNDTLGAMGRAKGAKAPAFFDRPHARAAAPSR